MPGGHGRPNLAAPDALRTPIPDPDSPPFAGRRYAAACDRAAAATAHRRPGGAGRDRRLGLFVAAAEADIGEPLQQRQLGLLRMLFLGLAAGLPDFGLRRHREILEFRHPRRADRRTFGRLRDEGFRCRRLLGLDAGGLVMIREQRRLLRDRADRDVAIGRRLDRRLLRRLDRRGDRGERGTLDIAGRALRRRGS